MLDGDVRNCTRCVLASSCLRPVPGRGSPAARLLFVGQSPGAEEDAVGRPFIGPSGRMLCDALVRHSIPLDEVYLTNAGKCHPPGNRKYRKAEQAACLPWLAAEVALWTPAHQPAYIVAVGADALSALLPKVSLSEGRKSDSLEYAGKRLTAILHPAAVLRDSRRRPEFEADIGRLATLAGYATQTPYWANYIAVTSDTVAADAVAHIRSAGVLGFDTEFGWPAPRSLIGFSVSWADSHAAYFPPEYEPILRIIVKEVPLLAIHSTQADVPVVCEVLGMPIDAWPWGRTVDTCIAAYVLRERNVGLKDLTYKEFGINTLHFEDVAKSPEEFANLDLATQARYACADADFARQLWVNRYAALILGMPGADLRPFGSTRT